MQKLPLLAVWFGGDELRRPTAKKKEEQSHSIGPRRPGLVRDF
jgi:hypothetical protein